MPPFTLFEDVEKLLFDFEETLKKHDVKIQPGSNLDTVCLAVLDLLHKKNTPQLVDPKRDLRHYFAGILGVKTFMTKVVALRDHVDFPQVVPHLRKLNCGQVAQNSPSGVLDQVSPKLFELLIALAAMRIGTNLEVDDPDRSSGGKNPDILVTVDNVRYGLACKAVFGHSTPTLVQNIEKGIDQIERSPADAGFVIVNVKDLINHNFCWPSPEDVEFPDGAEVDNVAWPDLTPVHSYLYGLANKRVLDMEREIELPVLRDLFSGKKAIPVVTHFLHTATALAGPTSPVATSVLFLHCYGFGATIMGKLNDALQDHTV